MILNKVTLSDLISVGSAVRHLDAKHKSVTEANMSDGRRHVLLTNIYKERAQLTYNLIGKKSTRISHPPTVDFLFSWYSSFISEFDTIPSGEWWKEARLPEPELTHMSPIVFGQFIDAKMIIDGGIASGTDKWEMIQYIIAIFAIGKKKYHYDFTYEKHRQFIDSGKVSAYKALLTSIWWDKLNVYINENYTVFQDSGDSRANSENMDEHMMRWGWVNFLKGVAKTKAFDISGSGMNSIDCVRATKASEILLWASEEKDANVAMNRDMKAASKQ